MTWRVVSISHRSKLDYKMGYLEIRQGNSFSKVHLSEIATIIIESTAVSLTTYLINELIAKKINVIFCDENIYHPLFWLHYMVLTIHLLK